MQALRNIVAPKQGGRQDENVELGPVRFPRRYVAFAAVIVFLYLLFTEILMVSMDMFHVKGGSPTEVKGVYAQPAFNFVFGVGALPFAFVFSYGNPRHPKRIVHLALGAAASLLALIASSSYLQLMCAYSSRDMSQLCDLALQVQSEVDQKFGANKMWIIKGNLLAIARKQSDINYLIANDHDFDFCATPDLFDDDKLAKHLEEKRYVFEKNIINERGTRKVTVFPHNLPLYKYHSGPPMVDIDECDAPTELIKVEGCNKGTFYISNRWEEWLNGEYGTAWRKPVNLNHKGLCAVSSWW
jgi:hypothetical protein